MNEDCLTFIPHPYLEPVAQMDLERRLAEPEGARSSRAGFAFPGSSRGRTPVFGTGDEGSSPSPGVFKCAGVVQPADTPPSEGGPCEFESHLPYSSFRVGARVAQTVRGGSLKNCLLRVRVSPRASRKFGGVCKWTKRLDLQSSARSGFAGSSPAAPATRFSLWP